MYKNRSQGFTLIELLVVIAIIGILSAVVLASLNTARSKGNDAAIQSDLSTIRVQAELYYDGPGNNSYGTNTALESSCTATDNMFSNSNIARAAAGANGGGTVTCNVAANGTAYAVSAPLVASIGNYWCIDSTSVGKLEPSALGTATMCP